MRTVTKITAVPTNQDNRFLGVDHTCLLPGKSSHKCDHWGCKVTAKSPQYYPGYSKFFAERGTTHFHVHRTIIADMPKEHVLRMPEDLRKDRAWLTPMPTGENAKPNLNTGWTVKAEGYWPDRSIYSFDEVSFIHVEYETLRSKSDREITKLLSDKNFDKTNCEVLLNEKVMDVREVAIFVGKEPVNG